MQWMKSHFIFIFCCGIKRAGPVFPSAPPASLWQLQLKIPPAVHLCVNFRCPAARRLWFAEREASLRLLLTGDRAVLTASLCQTWSGGLWWWWVLLMCKLRASEPQVFLHPPPSEPFRRFEMPRLPPPAANLPAPLPPASSGPPSRPLTELDAGNGQLPPTHLPPTRPLQAGNGTERCQ